ncbi:MAG TPA: hypothetical protein VK892_16875 [Pyrinomonadaceae bacterium]|nr:hypothetical protein [Pyrinomonadaceae bacterium]
MIPAVRLPKNSKIRIPVDLKLKPNWRYEPGQRIFVSGTGKEFNPISDLPENTKIVYKVPSLVDADESKLSKSEKDLRRYLQVILPPGKSPAEYVDVIRSWRCVEEAHTAPEISLP